MFDGLVDEALAGCDPFMGLDLSDVAVNGSQLKAPLCSEATGVTRDALTRRTDQLVDGDNRATTPQH